MPVCQSSCHRCCRSVWFRHPGPSTHTLPWDDEDPGAHERAPRLTLAVPWRNARTAAFTLESTECFRLGVFSLFWGRGWRRQRPCAFRRTPRTPAAGFCRPPRLRRHGPLAAGARNTVCAAGRGGALRKLLACPELGTHVLQLEPF